MRKKGAGKEIRKEAKAIFNYVLDNEFCSIRKAIMELQKIEKIRTFLSIEGHNTNFIRTKYKKDLKDYKEMVSRQKIKAML